MNPDPSGQPPVRFVGKRWVHHSAHSGYDRLCSHLGSMVEPLDLSRLSSRLLPERIAIPFVRRSHVVEYSLASFYLEWAAARDMFRHPRRTVYHVLYGDDTYRYLGSMRRPRRHPLVVSYHLPPDNLRERIQSTGHLRQADAIVVVGTNQIPFFAAHTDPDRVHFVPHGIDTDAFSPPEPAGRKTADDQKLVLFVGSHRRDMTTLDAVIRKVSSEDPGVRFVLVTRAVDGESYADMPNVTVTRQISEDRLIDWYRGATVLVQPLEESTANNSILEALACGLPVVATRIGGVADYLDAQSGVLTRPGDAADMAAATLSILRDGARCQSMRESARRTALAFSWPAVAERLREIYRRL